ncbi:DUF917 domain-containing protein [Pseudonocardia asaccharolytica]|uniref:DUF917 domain-containing protein n=1 Tax=Pseudonocardia asaccharolytica DSM 44247 = NBRC 16224 TaxID=1123024 RepID=A0A511CVS1_9PSEU|nr:DUF917 domain-containing protein [Pseudonocardia asaccharolytica]GEL16567.1 hypothetical protein PA7_04040 [Pseudonocardia asaccharolytica DSM 44247 = NBRC 16224]
MTTLHIDLGNLPALALGCTVFAGGGGGDPRIGEQMAMEAIREFGPVEIRSLDAFDDDDLIMPCGMIGAPTVMVEKIPNGAEGRAIRETYERMFGRPVTAVMPFEMGGINGVLPVAWAAYAGLPLLDADFMGRAFPELQMLTPHLYGMSGSPAVITDERMQTVVFNTRDNIWLEKLVRNCVASLGGSACGGLYPMSVGQARRPAIAGTVSKAIRMGETIRRGGGDPIDSIVRVAPVVRLGQGKVVDIERRTSGGFVRGSALIEGLGTDKGRLFRLEFQNENLVVLEDGEPLATVPDIITLLDIHTGHGIVTEGTRYGQRIQIVAFPSPPVWTTAEGLRAVGPRAFGYDFDFLSVADRHA